MAHISRVYSNEKSERVKLICNVRFLLKPFFLETKLNINTVKHSNLLLLLLRHARNTFHNFTRYFCYFVEFSVFLFSFCFCEIFICNFEYRSMLYRLIRINFAWNFISVSQCARLAFSVELRFVVMLFDQRQTDKCNIK